MALNNCLFILFFLLPVLIAYHIAARISNRAGLMVLLAASIVFYSRQGWQGTVFMVIAILVNYTAGLLIERLRDRQQIQGRVFLGAILLNIGMLALLKWLPEPGNPYYC
jgi:alginate O-acetyltransferase complex protein AlgI